ncbi:tyrosine-type recombinase/integrase [Tabrizicola sp.]|uniref:tyrosine-type recombinase/integrase n=1 Tax=Tabrizicola sp. TaxID=2005166 RepID=UPI003F3BEEC4
MPKMTKRAVDALERPAKSQEFLWDSELRGFGVRVVPSGLKTFVVQYRTAEGRSRRLAIGRYGLITVEQARDQAKIKLGMVAGGVDPAQQEDVPEDNITVSELCDWYLEEAKAGRILGRRNRAIKASSLAMDESRIKTHIKPLLGNRLVSSLRIVDVEGMQSDIVLGKTAKARGTGRGGVATGGPGVAGRAVATLQSIFAHAVRHDKIERHPSLGARRLAAKRKVRRLSLDELGKLGQAMRFAERNGESQRGLAVVRFLALTGFRRSEAQQMRRDWLHAEAGYVAFPDTKGDAQVRAIGPSAARLAAAQPIQAGSPFVFPATMGAGSYTGAKACLQRLCATVAIENVTPHTLRHTFASIAGELGFSELVIAAMLGHSAQSVTQGYVHVDDALRVAVARTCDEIAALLDS